MRTASPSQCNPQSAIRNPQCPRAFTLIEMLIVLIIVGIAVALTLPTPADTCDLKLQQAARLLAADLEFAQTESISHPDNLRLVKFNTTNHSWWVAAASAADTPVSDPANPASTMLVSPGSGRATGLSGVTIASINVGGDSELQFNAYGAPDQSTTASITLSCGTNSITVQVAPGTGEVTIP